MIQPLDLRTLLRLAQGIVGDPEIRDYSGLVAAVARHEARLMERPVFTRPVDAAAALLHTIVRLEPLTAGNPYLAWTAAYSLLGFNGLQLSAKPQEAVDFLALLSTENWNERRIAEGLARFL